MVGFSPLPMKKYSPLVDKILYGVSMALIIAFLIFLTANLLVNAIAPSKPPLFNVILIGLVGLIVSCFASAFHKIFWYKEQLPLWIYAPTVLFLFMGIGGILADVLFQ